MVGDNLGRLCLSQRCKGCSSSLPCGRIHPCTFLVSFIGPWPNQLSATNATTEATTRMWIDASTHRLAWYRLDGETKDVSFRGRARVRSSTSTNSTSNVSGRPEARYKARWFGLLDFGEPLSSRSLRFRSFRVALRSWHRSVLSSCH